MSREHQHPHGGHGHAGAGHDHPHPDHRPERGWRRVVALFRHDHHHDHDTAAVPSDREGMRALWVSLVVLSFTAVAQLFIALASGSVALLADTVHNVSDALTAIPLAVAFWVGRRAPTARYTYGFGRAEDLAGLFIVAMIAVSAVVAGWEAIDRLADPEEVRHVGWVFVAGLVGFAGNEWVASYRIRVGRRMGSAALVADGLHARADGFTSLAVVAGAAGSAAGWDAADPIVGLLITVAILGVLRRAAVDIYRRLMDSVDPDLVGHVRAVLGGVEGVEDVDTVRIRWIGHQLHAEAEVVTDCDISIAAAHAITEVAHHRLLHEIPRLVRVTIHASPCSHDGRDHHHETAHHFGP